MQRTWSARGAWNATHLFTSLAVANENSSKNSFDSILELDGKLSPIKNRMNQLREIVQALENS